MLNPHFHWQCGLNTLFNFTQSSVPFSIAMGAKEPILWVLATSNSCITFSMFLKTPLLYYVAIREVGCLHTGISASQPKLKVTERSADILTGNGGQHPSSMSLTIVTGNVSLPPILTIVSVSPQLRFSLAIGANHPFSMSLSAQPPFSMALGVHFPYFMFPY